MQGLGIESKGCLLKRDECLRSLKEYWNYRDELSILDALVLKGTRIVIPKHCWNELLDRLHEGHFGIDRTRLQARNSVFWPSINKDVETLIKTCETCQENSRRNAKDPVLAREILLVPWTLLEIDLFSLEDHTFLLVVEVTSHFPVVRILPNESSRSMTNAWKGIYSDFGLPRRVLSENGPCFKSHEFTEFHATLSIVVERTSAYNQQSVGSVEWMIQTIN